MIRQQKPYKPCVTLQPMTNYLKMHKQAISRDAAAKMIAEARNVRITGESGIVWHGCYRQQDAHGRNVYVILSEGLREVGQLTVSRRTPKA